MATMPEIHFRLVAVSSDGREITFPSAELHSLGEFGGTLFLRFKENRELTREQVASVIGEIQRQFDGKPVVILPWYIDLIKLVPVR